MPKRASASTEKPDGFQKAPRTCLVRVVMQKGTPQIIAAPIALTAYEDQAIDEAMIQGRNACLLLQINTRFSTRTGPDGEEETSEGETTTIYHIGKPKIEMLGRYKIMRAEEGRNGYSSSFTGFLVWSQFGKSFSKHFLVYRATLMESGHLTKWKPKKREAIQVEKLGEDCHLETITPHK